ncbi:hypothetical protein [Caldinitratiruptor microaerophilus]|uniref:Uncharacterized protein n=1 Tax=Caldinitratiruptor microaerophilus TaxID=671077 RepID=A0AA35GB20_9FIRM|nr:hypothetical protein [Caldinitratiruptor microaerophilus]BDG61909.1 hypothetical protein caldi_29990 [Caldinitratiruptor microaerophilus]
MAVDDVLDRLEAEGRKRRVERRAARHTPEAKEKRNRGRTQARRGYRAEKEIEARLERFGFRRVPLSGRLGGRYSGDLRREGSGVLTVLEVKRRQGGQKQLRAWLAQGGAQGLVLVPGGGDEPVAAMTLSTLERLLEEAGYLGGAGR